MQNKYILAAVGILAVAGMFVLVYRMNQTQPITNFPSKGTDIIAFGDSLVVGYGATRDHDFVTLLSRKIGKPIVNLGLNGDTTQAALDRLKQFDQYNPKVVLILLGGNDALGHVPPSETFGNLRTIVSYVQKRGAVVVLLGVRGGIVNTKYPGEFQKLADEMHTAYVPDVLDGLFGDTKFMEDGIHPNDAGNVLIAEKIYPVLKPLLK